MYRRIIAAFFIFIFGLAGISLAQECNVAAPFSPVVRRDFNDIGWFLCPDAASKSVGAQVSATFNELQKQTSISGDGVGALVYRYVAIIILLLD